MLQLIFKIFSIIYNTITKPSSLLDFFIRLRLRSIFICLIFIDLILFYSFNLSCLEYFINSVYSYALPNGNPTEESVDPTSYWSTGVPQFWTIIGTGLATFKALGYLRGCSPRLRVLGALGLMGISTTTILYHTAIENQPVFARFMYALSEVTNGRSWPSAERMTGAILQETIKTTTDSMEQLADKSVVNSTVSEVSKVIESGSQFISDGSDVIIQKLLNAFFNLTFSIISPVKVEAYLDDMIGQQIILHIILFILAISILFLFLFYIMNLLILSYRDQILGKLNNKFIVFIIKFELGLAKIATIYAPILIIIGLFVLIHGLYFLISHQIPYESLGIDLHTFISSKK